MAKVTIGSPVLLPPVEAHEGESLLEVLQRTREVYIDASCGGNGTCGTCAVRVTGEVSPPDEIERSLIAPAQLAQGIRLACRAFVAGDCAVEVPTGGEGASILATFEPLVAAEDPLVRQSQVSLPPASLDDQRPAARRLADALGVTEAEVPLRTRCRLAALGELEEVNVLSAEGRVIGVSPAAPDRLWGAAVDIGTSTIVVYLVDLATGLVLGSRSAMNPQKGFGADVISRIDYASRGEAELGTLQERVVGQLQELVDSLAVEHGGVAEEVVAMTVVGNTTMLHLLVGAPPAAIARAPFAPAFTDSMRLEASELGFRLHPGGLLWLLPSVSAYVGADIVAGIVATELDLGEKPALLIDLGTNCEVVLGDRSGMVACATAAGPAFEGAEIECGMAGVPGAVSRVWLDGTLHVETIGGKPARGICGSGILDTMALLVETGLAEPSGRLRSAEEVAAANNVPSHVAGLLAEIDAGRGAEQGTRRLRLQGTVTQGEEPEVYFSQRDIRQVQLAKAAVAAGIDVLLAERGLRADEIETLYLCGGFGSAMKPESAHSIGLFPEELRGRVKAVGNTAGRGAVLALRSRSEFRRFEEVRHKIRYVELSGHPLFMDPYVEHMSFPETDE